MVGGFSLLRRCEEEEDDDEGTSPWTSGGLVSDDDNTKIVMAAKQHSGIGRRLLRRCSCELVDILGFLSMRWIASADVGSHRIE